jgi:hypothetical protein
MEQSNEPVSVEGTRWSAGRARRHHADAHQARRLPLRHLTIGRSQTHLTIRASEARFLLRSSDPVKRLVRDAVLSEKEAQLGRMFLHVTHGV